MKFKPEIHSNQEKVLSVFDNIASMIQKHSDKDFIKLHLGDSYMPPLAGITDFASLKQTPHHVYCHTWGVPEFRAALLEKIRNDNNIDANLNNLQVTCGITHGLHCAFSGLLNPGEEVLVLAPHWPLLLSVIRHTGVVPLSIPFYTELAENPQMDVNAYLQKFLTGKSAAIYVNSPNNPSGKVLSIEQIEALADFAIANNLWFFSDEAYEDFVFRGSHISPASIERLFPQTVTFFSFSKSYAAAGYRIGYVIAGEGASEKISAAQVATIYSPSCPAQYLLLNSLKNRREIISVIRENYGKMHSLITKNLEVPHIFPEGGFYIYTDLSAAIEKYGGFWQTFEKLLASGVSITPGEVCGTSQEKYGRICFTSEPPRKLERGIEILNSILC